MEWFKKIIEKLLKKDIIKLIEEPKNIRKLEDSRNNFLLSLTQTADLERNDGNGYKINSNIRLRDMI